MPHKLGMAAPPGTTSLAGAAGLAAAAGPAGAAALARATSLVPIKSFPACTTWMNEIHQGNIGLIELMKL
jgi:hypothetical protein